MRVPQNGWFRMETPVKMDDLGGTTIFGNVHIFSVFLCQNLGCSQFKPQKWCNFFKDQRSKDELWSSGDGDVCSFGMYLRI